MGHALTICDFLAVIVTCHSLESPWVEHEMNTFLANKRSFEAVLPLKFDDTQPSTLSPLLHPSLYADFSHYESGLERLLKRLGAPTHRDQQTKDDFERLEFAIDLSIKAGNVAMRFFNSALEFNAIERGLQIGLEGD